MGVFDPKPSFRGATGMERMASAMDMPFSFGQAFGENFAQGIADSFGLGTAIRELTTPPLLSNRPFRGETKENYEARRARVEAQTMSEDEYKSSPFFRESVPFTPGMTSDRAAALAKFADTRAVRQYFSQKQPIAAFLGQFGGQALDPINYVPVFGQGAQLAAVARFGSIGGRALLSASEAAINTAAFGILTSGVRERLGDDVSFQMIGTEIAMSALIGGAFGGGIGMLVRGRDARERVALAQARNALSTASNRQKAAIALNEQIDALATTGEPAATPNGMAGIEAVTGEVQRRVTAARSLDEQTAGVTGTKAGEVVIAPSGRRVSVRSEVVELDSLIHAVGALQVRNRRTAASDAQIEEIAANLDPARMMPNIDGSQGSPLVGSDNIVDSGNGRVAAVRRAYEAYPERAEAYRASLAAEGYDVSTMQRPVLISRRVTELDEAARAQFNAELNGRTTASLGAVEIAQMDRAAMTDSVLDVHAPAPVTAASNRAFVQRFMAELPANDRQALLTEDGKSLSAEGVRRIENALFASAYGDIDPSAVRRFTEGVDDNTRSIVGAMSDMAGAWTKMRRDAKAGVIPAHLDQTRELTDALRLIGMWREQAAREGRPVAKVISEGMAQMDLLTGEIRPEVQVFIRSFYTSDAFARAQGREALAGQFADLIESGYELGRPSLFGDAMPEVSALQVIENAVRRNAQADPRPIGDALSRAEENGAAQLGDQAGAVGGRDRQGAGGPFNSAAEADAAELLALADAGDIEAIKASPALARVTAEMRSRPETDKVDGYGTQEWMDARAYVAEDGSEITGVEAAQEYLLDNARNLAAKELGIERFETAKERKAVIVIGPPAAGKSTIANQIALRMRAAIPDADEAKKIMPEYAGGIGSNATHEESSFLTRYVMAQLKDDGDNMVIPKVGDKLASIEKLSEEMKAAGYTVDVVLMNVEPKEAFRRMIGRFVKTGRLIPPDYFDSVATAPARVYEELKAKGSTDGYAKIDSPREVQPRVSEGNLRTTDLAAGDEIPIGAGARDGGTNGSSGGSSEAGQVLAEADIFSHGLDLGDRPVTPGDISTMMRQRFRDAGRPDDEAEAAATMLSAFYSGMAARTGRSIADLVNIAPLPEVRRGEVMNEAALAQAARDLTNSPEFRRWFGDSKVVDAEGKPLVVYHGTDADIDAFDPAAINSSGRNVRLLGEGFYFTSDPAQAAKYGKNVIPVYLRMENPRQQGADGILASKSADQDGTIATGTPGTKDGERVFVVKDPTQIKSINNRGTFDPNDPRILYQGARGSIEFGSDGRSVMSMFDAADASTALHESAHWFLQMFRSFADRADAPAEIRADWERVRAWWTENADAVAADSPTGATGDDVRRLMETGTSGNRLVDIGIEVGMQEQWARGFEAYLREGVAPNEGLRGIFDQFKRWLTSIYRQALDLNVNINDDIRGVFDRLLTQERESLIPAPVKAQPDPPPTGLDVAAIETRKPADPMNLGAQYGLESNGGFAEEADIAALKANDLIDDEGVREMAAADQLVADADAYGKTLETAAWCMMH